MSLQDFSYNLGRQLNAAYSDSAMEQAAVSGYHLPTPNSIQAANQAPAPDVVRAMTEADVLMPEEADREEGPAGEPPPAPSLPECVKNAIAGTIYDIRHFDDIPGTTSDKVGYILRKDSRWMYFLGLFVVCILMFVVGANLAKWVQRPRPEAVGFAAGGVAAGASLPPAYIRQAPPAAPLPFVGSSNPHALNHAAPLRIL